MNEFTISQTKEILDVTRTVIYRHLTVNAGRVPADSIEDYLATRERQAKEELYRIECQKRRLENAVNAS